jgi:ribosomal protein S18 acetylase RimI-like enzyme
MGCQIIRNDNNKITNVLAENGKHSFLFETINNLPFVGNKEDAATYYMYALKNIKEKHKDLVLDENGEPILVFSPNSTKEEYYNTKGYVIEEDFTLARKQDFKKGGVRIGFLTAKELKERELLGVKSKQQSDFAKILEKAKDTVRVTFSDGVVKYAVPKESNFILFDTIQRNLEQTSYEGFIENLQDIGIPLNEKVEDITADFVVADISPTEKSVMLVNGDEKIATIRLKKEKEAYKVSGINIKEEYRGQGIASQMYLTAQELLGGVRIISDKFQTPNAKRVWEKLIRAGKAFSNGNGTYTLRGRKAVENALQFQIIGEKGAENVVKEKQILDKAKEMFNKGEDIDNIERQTGWFLIDGQWKKLSVELLKKFKIKDEVSNKTNIKQPLEEVLDDPSLFEYYPNIKNIKVVFFTREYFENKKQDYTFENTKGYFSKQGDENGVVYINANQHKEGRESTLAHEITHVLGDIEQFPSGRSGLSVVKEAFDMAKIDEYVINYNNYLKLKEFALNNSNNIIDNALDIITGLQTGDNYAQIRVYKLIQGEIDAKIVEKVYAKIQNGDNIETSFKKEFYEYLNENFIKEDERIVYRNTNETNYKVQQDNQILQEVLKQLEKSGLADNVYLLSNQEIENKLIELGYSAEMAKQVSQQIKEPYYEVINGFYSPLEKIISETKFDKLPAKQWIDKFAKGDEAKWTGLTEWLNQQQGSVSKTDIQNYLKENRIEIVEVVKGGEQKVHFNIKAEKGKSVVYKNGVKDKEFDTYDKADDYVTNYKESEVDATKFSQYQIEGEKEEGSYKEILVTLPNKKVNISDFIDENEDYIIEAYKKSGKLVVEC